MRNESRKSGSGRGGEKPVAEKRYGACRLLLHLAVDYVALGFTGDRDPRREGLSKTKRAAILAEMMAACQQYIGSEFIEVLRVRCQEILGNGEDWTLAVSEQDRNIVRFQYPTAAPTLD
jgi:hypothetical protein